MKQSRRLRLLARQRYGAAVALAILLLALGPHFYFMYKRGNAWQGFFPLTHGDEVVYAAYLNSQIDGRPRRSDPYTGRDDEPQRAQAESYFSIQFLPPAVLATAARATGASSSKTFFVSTFIAAVFSSLALFWMMRGILDDEREAAAGAVVVLTLGSVHLVATYLLHGETSYNYLAFLRRYVPSAALPFFFLFCGAVWRAISLRDSRSRILWAALAGACFAVLVYSYFYLWTSAVAWFVCFSLLWLAGMRGTKKDALSPLTTIAVLAAASLVPYWILISNRVESTDVAMSLVKTRSPDLLRLPELLGLLALIGVVYAFRVRRDDQSKGSMIFTAALALTPFVVFNQQVMTGRSLQPFHYGMFSVNYVVIAALFMSLVLVARTFKAPAQKFIRQALYVLVLAALLSGAYEALLAGRRHLAGNALRDSAFPAMQQLAANGRLNREEPLDKRSLVLCTDPTLADALPMVTPQPVLWAPHMINFPGVSPDEDKERLSLYLHFTGVSFDDVDPQRFDELDRAKKYFISSLISRGRHNPNLRMDWTPITAVEIETVVKRYDEFVSTVNRERIDRFPLTYLLTSSKENIDFTNLEKWYELDSGEKFEEFTLYRVKLRARN
jgi:hypothetical protein